MNNPLRRLVAGASSALLLGGLGLAVAAPLASAAPVQAPVRVPINVCGTTVGPVTELNPTLGNQCVNA